MGACTCPVIVFVVVKQLDLMWEIPNSNGIVLTKPSNSSRPEKHLASADLVSDVQCLSGNIPKCLPDKPLISEYLEPS